MCVRVCVFMRVRVSVVCVLTSPGVVGTQWKNHRTLTRGASVSLESVGTALHVVVLDCDDVLLEQSYNSQSQIRPIQLTPWFCCPGLSNKPLDVVGFFFKTLPTCWL